MQFKRVFGFTSALAILAIAAPAPNWVPASAPEKIEEKRQAPVLGVLAVASLGIAGIVAGVAPAIISKKSNDIAKRKEFTVAVVDKLKVQAPGENIVICNVDYSLSCTPDAKETVFFKPSLGKKVSYDVLIFGKGCTFDRKGDGGYENWAYTTTGCETNGGHIAC